MTKAPRVGVIGGTGFSVILEKSDPISVETPWGDVEVGHLSLSGADVFLVRRHGSRTAPPHRIVHRANVDALARCGVDAVLALNAVGALDPNIASGSLLVPDDYIDFRKSTETFFDDGAVHVDVGEAYCPTLRRLLLASAPMARDGGVYVATEGPRLETRAEIRMLRAAGGAVVGMTGCPEAALARERAMCYASLCLVTNPAAGVAPGALSAQGLRAEAETLAPRALDAVLRAARTVPPERACGCRRALDGARI